MRAIRTQSNTVTLPRLPAHRREKKERQDQGEQQEAHAIDLRLNDGDDPVQGVDREAYGQRGGKDTQRTGKLRGSGASGSNASIS